jgi:hypothetical protein
VSVDLKSKLATAKRPERTVEVCLRGDLQAEFEELDRQARELLDAAPADGRLVGNPERKRLADEIERLRAEMRESMVVFRLRALPRGRYTALMADHPPVDGNDRDRQLGYNPDAFFPDVVLKSIVEPEDIDADTWDALLDALTDHQFDEFVAAVTLLNHRRVDVPFSKAASLLTRPSEPESTPHGG